MKKVAILGGSGFTGLELLRILSAHPGVEVVSVTSRQFKGKGLSEVFPSLKGFYGGLAFSAPGSFNDLDADVAFSCLPHGASQEVVPELLNSGIKVVDLSADFRLRSPEVYNKWYGEHKAKDLIKEAVYGLPELYRGSIKGARLVANPGCYPTGALLALMPLLRAGLIDGAAGPVIIDSKSGVSGAGRNLSYGTSFMEVSAGFKAYKVGSHRHTPEIIQEVESIFSGSGSGGGVKINFTPHLLPVARGILSTVYAGVTKGLSTEDLHDIYEEAYSAEPFVRLMPVGEFPNINQVRSSNFCDIGLWADKGTGRVIIVSAIDNLVKGASGQAVQNMNLIEGFDETTALLSPPAFI
ncbi:MAG: N-acetyl-gamma-glutamyl-phosphate reductase [Thermodesulfobacteriota bacterium]